MGATQRNRVLLISGVGYFLCSGLAFSLVPPLPHLNAPVQEVAAYFAANRAGYLANLVMNSIAQVLFIVFLSALGRILDGIEGASGLAARIAVAAGRLTATLLLVFTIISGSLVYHPTVAGDLNGVRMVFDMLNLGFTLVGLPIACFLSAVSTVLLRHRIRTVLGWFGFAVAAGQFVAAIGITTAASSPIAPGQPFVFACFGLYFLWVLLVSILLREEERKG